MAAKFVSKLVFSQDDVANSERFELAFESLLRWLKVNHSVIDAVRVNDVTHHTLFKDLAQDEQQLKTCAEAFGIDTSEAAEFPHQREMTKLIGAWRQAKRQSEVKAAADAAARAHGAPVTILSMDWNSLMENFRVTFGPDLCDNELPAESHHEDFEESLAEGSPEAERLRDVVSEEEAQDQRRFKADPARQCGMHLDGNLTLQTRRELTSSEAANQEQLRAKYTVLQKHVALGAAAATREVHLQGFSPSPLSMITSIAGMSTTAKKLTGSCCHSRAGRTVCHMNLRSGRMLTKCAVYVPSESQLP